MSSSSASTNRGRGPGIALAVSILTACVTVLVAAPAGAHDTTGHSTLEQTIVPVDPSAPGFKFLKLGPGEPYLLRQELATANPNRSRRRVSLLYFGQITDWQLPDEESPAREERFDNVLTSRASTSGHRPQEALAPQTVEATVRQMNLFLRSPVRQGSGAKARMANSVMTGDLADSMQRNETRWVRILLEGGRINPGSGTSDFTGTHCQGLPSSAVADGTNPARYTGVQDYDDYALDNSMFWDPESLAGQYATDNWPTYPNLLDRAQAPFQAQGVRAPTYVVFGNHDALYQGTVSAGPGLVTPFLTFEDMAIDCLKPVYPLPGESSVGPPPNPADLLAGIAAGQGMLVPPDRDRQFVDKHQFKDIFRAGSQADDHGFAFIDPAERAASNDQASYYSFSPKPGIRQIVLDTASESGQLISPSFSGPPSSGSEGNIDHPQWLWLENELDEAEQANQLVILFAHHNVKTLENALPDEAAPCSGIQQFGHDRVNPSCDRDPRLSSPLHGGDELVELLHQHPHAVAFVAGHTHENEIEPFPAAGGGGFWQITSPATADWPPQHRVIDLMDNRDCTLSLFTTILDHDSPSRAPASGTNAGGFGIGNLASVGRTVTFNDPQVGPGHEGSAGDRNTELVIGDPRPCDPPNGNGNGDGDGDGDEDGDGNGDDD